MHLTKPAIRVRVLKGGVKMSKSNPPKPPTDVAGGAEEQKEVDINTLTLRLEEAVAKTTQFYSILLGTKYVDCHNLVKTFA